VSPNFERLKFRGARCRLAAAEQPRAGSVLEPARPEMASRILQDLLSRPTALQPEENPWDFDGYELTSARNRTRRSPMLSHETSPVSGASVVEMTIWVGQGRSHLPADVPGITAMFGQGGRLRLKDRLHQQLAGIFTTGGPSQRRRQEPLADVFLKATWTRQD
jgi:hypothetical protein